MKKRFAIIDIETTGGLPKRDKITEIAIVIHDGKKVLDQFDTLINPERSIPPEITRITGITNEMVEKAPKFYERAKKVVEMTEGKVFVAHNVRFDYGFIKEEYKRLGYTFTRRQLCTARLSRKVFPFLESHSLGNLIRHFNIKVQHRHRALDDALAASVVFQKAMEKNETKKATNKMITRGVRDTQLPASITYDQLLELPEQCGVYYFYNSYNKLIYIGKAINIQKRVFQHFRRVGKKAENLFKMVERVDYKKTGSELAALLVESSEIKANNPDINRAQRSRIFKYFIYAEYDQRGYAILNYAKLTKKNIENKYVIGRFKNMQSVRHFLNRLIEQFELCAKLCSIDVREGACFFHRLEKCYGACIGQETAEEYNTRVDLAIQLSGDRFDRDFMIVDRGRTYDERTLFLIRDGHFVGLAYVDKSEPIDKTSDLEDRLNFFETHPDYNRIVYNYLVENPSLETVELT